MWVVKYELCVSVSIDGCVRVCLRGRDRERERFTLALEYTCLDRWMSGLLWWCGKDNREDMIVSTKMNIVSRQRN